MKRKKSTAFCKLLPRFMLWSCNGYHSPWRCLNWMTAFYCNKIVSSYILTTLRCSNVKGKSQDKSSERAEAGRTPLQVAVTSSFDLLWLKDNYVVATESHTVSLIQYMWKRYSDIGDTADNCAGFSSKNRDGAIIEAPVVPCLTTTVASERVSQAPCRTCLSHVKFTPETPSVVPQCFTELEIPSWDILLEIHFLFLRTESKPTEIK